MSKSGVGSPRAPREPMLNSPLVVTALVVFLICTHLARLLLGGDALALSFARGDLQSGRITSLITYQFVHANWAHVLMNAVFVLAFGAPVARYLGSGVRGGILFLLFFLACGVAAALGYGLVMDGMARLGGGEADWALLGASGAASGLMGGAVRLMQGRRDGAGSDRGRVGSLAGRTVVAMSLGWIGINLVLGLTGLTPGTGGAPVAWQAHIVGYFVGLLAIGAFGRLAGDHAIVA